MRARPELPIASKAKEPVAITSLCRTRDRARTPARPRRTTRTDLSAGDSADGCLPKGFAFEISDLLLAKGWASFHNLTLSVRLDHGSEDEEYEEVIEVGTPTGSRTRFIIWNDGETVFVQPMPGKIRRHSSVAEALDGIRVKPSIILTDITATSWPL